MNADKHSHLIIFIISLVIMLAGAVTIGLVVQQDWPGGLALVGAAAIIYGAICIAYLSLIEEDPNE